MILRYSRTLLKKNFLLWSIFLYLKVITQLPMQLPTCRFYYIIIFLQNTATLGLALYCTQWKWERTGFIAPTPGALPSFPFPQSMTDGHLDQTPWGHTRKQGRPRMRRRDNLDSFGKTLAKCSAKRGPVEVNGEGLCPTG